MAVPYGDLNPSKYSTGLPLQASIHPPTCIANRFFLFGDLHRLIVFTHLHLALLVWSDKVRPTYWLQFHLI